jgi:hypothetical protein
MADALYWESTVWYATWHLKRGSCIKRLTKICDELEEKVEEK